MFKSKKVMTKNWKMPSEKELKKRFCQDNLRKIIPKRCKVCGSKYLYFDSDAGPIVGGVGTCSHPPNAHSIGAWICMDCISKYPLMKACSESNKKKESLQDILKCSKCGKPFKKIDEHTYEFDCNCSHKKLRVSVG